MNWREKERIVSVSAPSDKALLPNKEDKKPAMISTLVLLFQSCGIVGFYLEDIVSS